MGILTTKLALVAALAAAVPPALDLPPVAIGPPPGVDRPPVVVDIPPVARPKLPDLPAPAAPAVPDPTPTPAAVPETSVPTASPEATTASATPAATPAAGGGRSTPGAADRSPSRTASPRRSAPRARTRAAAPRAGRLVAAANREAQPVAAAGKDAREPAKAVPEATPEPREESRPPLAGVIDVVEDLPTAVLWALLGIATLALGLAGSAFWQSRQRAALEAQREELLDDIGLLSGALLPPIPHELDGLAVSAAYRPAEGPAAGGDFYDVFCLGDGRIGILLGDVSGHGRDSVTQAALARYTLRTLLAAGHAPGAALGHADRLLTRDLPPHFVTVVAAVYDATTAILTYAKAGHAPPIVLGADHDPDAEAPACPIGLGLGEAWPEFELALTPGVSVCLYTDGLEDARLGRERLGRARVAELLRDAPDATRLLAAVGERADVVTDDTAAVVLTAREHHVVAVGA